MLIAEAYSSARLALLCLVACLLYGTRLRETRAGWQSPVSPGRFLFIPTFLFTLPDSCLIAFVPDSSVQYHTPAYSPTSISKTVSRPDGKRDQPDV